MKPRTRHKRRLVRYRRRNLTVFGTFKFPDGHYSYQLQPLNYNYVVVDSLTSLWQRGYAEITLQYWQQADRRIRSGYIGLSTGLREALWSTTPSVDEFPTHLDELENPRIEGYYFEHTFDIEDPEAVMILDLYGEDTD
jgi:hypothetical protein